MAQEKTSTKSDTQARDGDGRFTEKAASTKSTAQSKESKTSDGGSKTAGGKSSAGTSGSKRSKSR